MPRTRIRIVTGLGRARSPQRFFIVGSLLLHLVGAAALIWIPALRRGPRIPPNATVVELVGALPGSQLQPGPTTRPPEPEPAAPERPPEGVTLETKEPELVPEPKPEKKPEKKPEEKPEPVSGPPAAPAQPDEQAAATGDTVGSADTGGSISALDVGDAAFAWYRAAVTNALYGHWRRPVVGGLREPVGVRVAFEIMRDGNVRGIRVEESSGVPMLDRSALRAVGDAAPLPPLPSSLHEPYLPASFVFRLYPEGY